MFDSVHTVTASGTGEMFEKLVNVGKNDVVIAFSFPRYSSVTVKGAECCRSVGATVIGLTNSSLSPLADSCDHLLLAKSDMVSVVDSLVAPLSVVNALIVALAAQREDALAQTFNTLEKVWDENHVYEKRVDNL
jgi:DNA-binding MurR/RpiR family transcriptional regulator